MKKFLKRSLSILLAITLIFSSAYVGLGEVDFSKIDLGSLIAVKAKAASSGTCGDNLIWTLDDEGTLTISGTGAMTNYSSSSSVPWYSLRSNITTAVIETGVTSISDFVFSGCTNLTSVTIGNCVTSIGDYAFRDCTSLTSITIPDSVISIGKYIFYYCTSLTSVTIGSGVTSIGGSAFEYCTSLASVDIPNSVTSIGGSAFADCTRLTSVDIPNSVTSIGYYAFFSCTSLTSITIPDSVTSIGGSAFEDCTSLVSITISDSVERIGSSAFSNTKHYNDKGNWEKGVLYIGRHLIEADTSITGIYEIKPGTKCLADSAFIDCKDLMSVSIPNGIKCISNSIFRDCEKLFSIIIPDSVTSIVNHAFFGCRNLASVTIPNGVTSISKEAFRSCISLTSIAIPDSVTNIGDSAFQSCIKLASVTIPNSVTSIGEFAFSDCTSLVDVFYSGTESEWSSISIGIDNTYLTNAAIHFEEAPVADCLTFTLNADGKSYSVTDCDPSVSGEIIIPSKYNDLPVTSIREDAFYWCVYLTSVTIPDSVTNIGDSAFQSCIKLASVTIPDSVTSIGRSAFYDCVKLSSITIPDSVTSVGGYAFYDCVELTSITIPNSVTSIGDSAFEGCTSLASITISNSVTSIDEAAFYGCIGLESIDVDENNNYYSSVGGVLFNKDKTTLIQYPAKRASTSYIIPDSVTRIGNYAFFSCTNLTSIIIPDSVINIEEGAFYDCGLTSVTIGNNVTMIGYAAFCECTNLTFVVIPNSLIGVHATAFQDCTSLENVFYLGTESEWSSTIIDWGNTYLTNAAIHYNATRAITQAPNCTTVGSKSIICPACGLIVTETIPAIGHTLSDWIIDKNATVNAAGSQHKECTVCNATLETAVIPQLKPATPKLSSVANTPTGVKFVWGKVTGADSYVVYRRTYNATTKAWGGWTNLGKTTATSFVDGNVISGTYYIYTVKAANEAGYSGYNATGLKIYCLATPTLASVTNSSAGVTVKWGKVAGATSYVVYRRAYNAATKKWSGWTNLGKITAVSFADKTAKSGNYYIYTVKALAGTYTSGYNATGLKTYFLSAPALSSVTSTTSGVKFTWGKVTGASGYIVYRRTYNATTKTWSGWTNLGKTTSASFVDKSAKKGTYYVYTTKAYYGSYTSSYNTTGLKVKDVY